MHTYCTYCVIFTTCWACCNHVPPGTTGGGGGISSSRIPVSNNDSRKAASFSCCAWVKFIDHVIFSSWNWWTWFMFLFPRPNPAKSHESRRRGPCFPAVLHWCEYPTCQHRKEVSYKILVSHKTCRGFPTLAKMGCTMVHEGKKTQSAPILIELDSSMQIFFFVKKVSDRIFE